MLTVFLLPVSLPLPLGCVVVVVVVVFGRVIPVTASPMFRIVLPLLAEATSVEGMLFSGGGHNTEKKSEHAETTTMCFELGCFPCTWIRDNGHRAWCCND